MLPLILQTQEMNLFWTEGLEPSSKFRLDRSKCYAIYYKAKRKAKRQDEHMKREQVRDAAARTVAEA
jgi:hypothetical protein